MIRRLFDYKDKMRSLLTDLYGIDVTVINNTSGASISNMKGYLNENVGLLEVISSKCDNDYEEKLTFKFGHINKIEFKFDEAIIHIDASDEIDDMLDASEELDDFDSDDEMDNMLD